MSDKNSSKTSVKVHAGKEIWKDVVGYEGLYQVSDWGRVKSLARVVIRGCRWGDSKPFSVKEKILKPGIGGTGKYPIVVLNNGSPKSFNVHQLVLEAFVGPRPAGMDCARHLDGDSTNNHLSNLCWGTDKENCQDMTRHGTVPCGEKNGLSLMKEDEVREARRLHDEEGVSQHDIAKVFGVSDGCIYAIVHRINWKHLE